MNSAGEVRGAGSATIVVDESELTPEELEQIRRTSNPPTVTGVHQPTPQAITEEGQCRATDESDVLYCDNIEIGETNEDGDWIVFAGRGECEMVDETESGDGVYTCELVNRRAGQIYTPRYSSDAARFKEWRFNRRDEDGFVELGEPVEIDGVVISTGVTEAAEDQQDSDVSFAIHVIRNAAKLTTYSVDDSLASDLSARRIDRGRDSEWFTVFKGNSETGGFYMQILRRGDKVFIQRSDDDWQEITRAQYLRIVREIEAYRAAQQTDS